MPQSNNKRKKTKTNRSNAKLKYGDNINGTFITAFRELTKITNLPLPVRYKLLELDKQLKGEYKKFLKLKEEIVSRFALKDDSGKYMYDPTDNYMFADGEKAKCDKEYGVLLAKEFEIEITPIKLKDLDNSQVSVDHLSVLIDKKFITE